MSSDKLDIIIIRGAPGAGKSQSAKCLSKFYPKGVRLEVDILRSMVISVDWTNQGEHINMLNISTKLVYDFIKLGFGPVIVVDTFSSDKIVKYLDNLNQPDKDLSIRVFGLYTSEEELKRRIQSRKKGEFRKYDICQRLNEEVRKKKYAGEYQIDTTGLLAKETAKIIFDRLNNTSRPVSCQVAKNNRDKLIYCLLPTF